MRSLRMILHVFLGAEHDRASGTGLDASRLESDRYAVRAQRAFIGLVSLLGDARNVERAAGHAITAADAILLMEVDDAVGVLDDRAGRGARFQATRICAMHAAVLANQPLQFAVRSRTSMNRITVQVFSVKSRGLS